MTSDSHHSYLTSLIAGGFAGTTVDLALFPFDTIKTRLQSPQGFLKTGGFHGLYKGIGPAFLGSAPTAALFFCSYDFLKKDLSIKFNHENKAVVHMIAAACGEVVACLIRVPTEILKQRKQAGLYSHILQSCRLIYRNEGILGFYRGLGTTILREIPFAIIQFPLWEALKVKTEEWKGQQLLVGEKALCGALAGGVAAGLTTPIDVAKTRIMLSHKTSRNITLLSELQEVYTDRGIRGLFAGLVPRVLWITMGGAIFFGSYELSCDILSSIFKKLT